MGLVVSGGHTDLILLESLKKWTWIGGTRDDAAGEAFDKAARILGLPYPGGPEIEKAAGKITDDYFEKNKNRYKLPRPLIHDPGLEMSFSGIKAAMARLVEKEVEMDEMTRNLVAREFAEAMTEVLTKKTLMAMERYHPKSVILAGGVAANKRLRESLRREVEMAGIKFFVPELRYCGDNAVMVGAAAVLRPEETGLDLRPEPSLSIV
ncbi:MAG: hypothetical protein ACD_61C00005G0001 [uncultured bacterium]|nr:MAG: hypothetical protein ACD_61C00005G0001 [uncultured bacterium]